MFVWGFSKGQSAWEAAVISAMRICLLIRDLTWDIQMDFSLGFRGLLTGTEPFGLGLPKKELGNFV